MPTLIGVLFILASLACFFRSDDSLLGVVFFSSIFEASSVISAGTFGVQPYYAVASLFILQMGYRKAFGQLDIPRFSGRSWIILFAVIAIASAIVLPVVFEGTAVYNPYAGIDNGLQLSPPLHLALANFTQSVYLVIDALLVIGAANTRPQANFLYKAYLASFYFLTGIIFIQFLCLHTGIPFPYSLLQNHGGYSLQSVQAGSWGSRIPGTFTESSEAGLVLTTFTAGFLAERLRSGKHTLQILIGVAAILLVRSTMSLAGLAVIFVLLLLTNPVFRTPRYLKLRTLWRSATLVGMAIVGVAFALLTPLRQSILGVTAGKGQTSSYIDRMAADAYALQLFVKTHGLGVGMGSNRPSSLIPSLLSTVGLLGFVVFAIMIFRLLKNADGEYMWVRWMCMALIFTMCFGDPDFTSPWPWVVMAFTIRIGTSHRRNAIHPEEPHEVSPVRG